MRVLVGADASVPACDVRETGLNYSSLSVGGIVVVSLEGGL
jgi:hypothetical protein